MQRTCRPSLPGPEGTGGCGYLVFPRDGGTLDYARHPHLGCHIVRGLYRCVSVCGVEPAYCSTATLFLYAMPPSFTTLFFFPLYSQFPLFVEKTLVIHIWIVLSDLTFVRARCRHFWQTHLPFHVRPLSRFLTRHTVDGHRSCRIRSNSLISFLSLLGFA